MVSLRIEIQSHTWWNPLRQREHDVTCVASAFQKHLPSISTAFVLRPMQTLQTCIPKNVFSLLLPEILPPCQFFSFSDQKTPSVQNCPSIPPCSIFSSNLSTKFSSVFFLPLDQTCLYKICILAQLVHYFNRLVPFAELPQTFPPWMR